MTMAESKLHVAADRIKKKIYASRDYDFTIPLRLRVGDMQANAVSFLGSWLDDVRAPHLLILGGYGSGKTRLAESFTLWQVDRWLERGSEFFPILCRLGAKNQELSVRDVMRLTLSELGILDTPFDDPSDVLLGEIELVVILDGIDEFRPLEMTGSEEGSVMEEIGGGLFERARVVGTCRSHYFLRQDEVMGLSAFGEWYEESKRLGIRDYFLIAKIDEWTVSERQDYLDLRGADFSLGGFDLTRDQYGLGEITGRPLFLRMLVDALEGGELKAGSFSNLWNLYREFTGRILTSRDSLRGVAPGTTNEICWRLARYMFERGVSSVSFTDLRLFEEREGLQLLGGASSEEVGLGDLLLRGDGDSFTFSHDSLYKFFVAVALLELSAKELTEVLALRPVFPESVAFLRDGRGSQKELPWRELEKLKNGGSGRLIVNLLSLSESLDRSALMAFIGIGLSSGNVEAVSVALRLAGYYGGQEFWQGICSHLNSDDCQLQYLAIEAAGLQRIDAAATAVGAAVLEEEGEIRRIAMWALRKIRSPELIPVARRLLSETDSRAIRVAAELLGMLQAVEERGSIEDALKSVDDGWVLYYLTEALDSIEGRRDFSVDRDGGALMLKGDSFIRGWLREARPQWQRRYVLEMIGEQRREGLLDTLYLFACDECPQVRNASVDAIGEMKSRRATRFLCERYAREAHEKVRANVIWALGNSGDINSFSTILEAIRDSSRLVREWAKWARKQIGVDEELGRGNDHLLYPALDNN